jgi:hypothetical protein
LDPAIALGKVFRLLRKEAGLSQEQRDLQLLLHRDMMSLLRRRLDKRITSSLLLVQSEGFTPEVYQFTTAADNCMVARKRYHRFILRGIRPHAVLPAPVSFGNAMNVAMVSPRIEYFVHPLAALRSPQAVCWA